MSKPYFKCVTGFGTTAVDAIVFDVMHSKDIEIFLKVWLFNCVAVLFSRNNWFDTWILYVLCIKKNNDKNNIDKHFLVAMVKLNTMTTISTWFYIVHVLRALIRKCLQDKINCTNILALVKWKATNDLLLFIKKLFWQKFWFRYSNSTTNINILI